MQRIARRLLAALVVGALTLIGLTGCGSNDNSAKSVDLSNVHFTGDPIKVMTESSYGNDTVDLKDPITVAQAAAAKINEDGGIAGHQLVVITCNDGSDANSAAACARQAKAEHVSAVIGGTSLNPQVVMPILQQAGIPWLGSQAVTAEDTSSKYSFPLLAGGLSFAGMAGKAVQDGCKSTAVVRYDLPVAAGVVQIVNGALVKAGAQPGTDIAVPPTTTSFDSIAAEVSQHDCAILAVPAQGFLGLAAATRASGGSTRFYTLSGTLSGPVLKQGGQALEGTVTSTSFPVASDPIWDAAKAAAPGVDWDYLYTQGTWVGYQVLANVLKASPLAKAKDVPASAVEKALSSAAKVSTDGFTPTLDFAKELPVPGLARIFNPTITFNKVQNGQLVVDGAPVNLAAALAG